MALGLISTSGIGTLHVKTPLIAVRAEDNVSNLLLRETRLSRTKEEVESTVVRGNTIVKTLRVTI